jgi:hypothetical protein
VTTLISHLEQIDGVWYIIFEATEFSPYALVVSSSAASYDETDGLPYYVNSGGTETFIGFAANGQYFAPDGVTVRFKENPKSFADTDGHWAKTYFDFVTERELFLGPEATSFHRHGHDARYVRNRRRKFVRAQLCEIEASGNHAFTDCE